MPNHPLSFYLKWDPKPPHNQWCCQPSENYRLMEMQHILVLFTKPGISAQKSPAPPRRTQATRHKLRAPSPLTRWPLMSRFEVFEMNMTVISSGQARHFSCGSAKQGVSWAGLAARPQGSDARMYIRRVPNIPISPICCPKEIGIIFVEGFTFLMEDKEEEINVELTKHWVNCFWGIRKKALDPWRVWFQIVSGLKVQRWWRASWWQPSRLLACVDLGDCNTDTWYTAFVWYRYNIIC